MSDFEKTFDIIFGRWKSQILYAGVKLGIIDCLTSDSKEVSEIAKKLVLDESLLYRLLRALGSLGFVLEESGHKFSISSQGELLKKDHIQTLQGILLLEEGPEHYQIWKHLPTMIKDGKQNAFFKEYGCNLFEYVYKNTEYSQIFNEAMNSYSKLHTNMILEALASYDFSKISHICDIGGGHGFLLCNLLSKYFHMKGTLLELESVISNKELLWASKMGLEDRCNYEVGDMFKQVPYADAYTLKMILHDWNDEECIKILSNIHTSSSNDAKIFIIEHIVTNPETPHFSKLFDIHMMCALSGRERTIEEFSSIFEQSGWKHVKTHYPHSGIIGVIEGIKK